MLICWKPVSVFADLVLIIRQTVPLGQPLVSSLFTPNSWDDGTDDDDDDDDGDDGDGCSRLYLPPVLPILNTSR